MTTAQNAHMRDMRYRWGTEGRCTRCGANLNGEQRSTCKPCCDYINKKRAERRARVRLERNPPPPPPKTTPKAKKLKAKAGVKAKTRRRTKK